MLTIHNMCAGMINKFGSAQQKEKLLSAMCRLDVKASYCLTEPGTYVLYVHIFLCIFIFAIIQNMYVCMYV